MTSVRKAIELNTLASLVSPLGNLIAQPMLALGLGVTGRGEVATALAPLLLASSSVTFGVPETLTYYVARSPKVRGRVIAAALSFLLVTGLAASGVVVVIALPLSGQDPTLAMLISLTALWIAPSLLAAALRGIASGHMAWHRVLYERIFTAGIRVAGLAILLIAGMLTVTSATMVMAAALCLPAVVYLKSYPRSEDSLLGQEGGKDVHRHLTGAELTAYAGKVWIGSIAGVLLMRLDQLLMTPLSSAAELGLYTVAASVSEVSLFFNSAVTGVVFASEADRSDHSRVATISRLSTIVTAAAGLGIGVNLWWAMPLFFGEEFTAAIPVTLILILAVIAGNPGSVAGASLSGRGKPGLRSSSIVIGLVANTLLVILLVPTTGAMGAALATCIGNILSSNMNLFFIRLTDSRNSISDFYKFRSSDMKTLKAAIIARVTRR